MESQCRQIDIESVLAKHADTVYKIALSQTKNKADAEDIFQEVFLRLMRNKTEILTDEHMKAWLIRVSLNCCKNLFASAFRRKTDPLTEDIPYLPPESQGVLREVLALPKKYRTVIHLFYYEDYSIEEISKLLNTKAPTVKSQLFRGRQLLKEKLKGAFAFNE